MLGKLGKYSYAKMCVTHACCFHSNVSVALGLVWNSGCGHVSVAPGFVFGALIVLICLMPLSYLKEKTQVHLKKWKINKQFHLQTSFGFSINFFLFSFVLLRVQQCLFAFYQ